jgi:YVTN family beta-propeller protein
LGVGCVFLVVFSLFSAFALLPQLVQAANPPVVTTTITGLTNPISMAITPNGAYAYVLNYVSGSGKVSVISTATNTITATVTVGSYPFGVAITPNSAYAT